MICNSHVGRLVRLNLRRTLRGVPFWACLAASWALYAFTCSGLSYNALEGYMRHWDFSSMVYNTFVARRCRMPAASATASTPVPCVSLPL